MQTHPTVSRSPVIRFFRWLTSWRIVRRLLIALVWVGTLFALFHALENWRGRKAWNEYRKQMEAKGEVLDFQKLIPAPIPDDQNFAATPFVQSWFQRQTNTQTGEVTLAAWKENDAYAAASRLVERNKDKKDERKMTELSAWAAAFQTIQNEELAEKISSENQHATSRANAAKRILQELRDSEPFIEELRSVSDRSAARYPLEYDLERPWEISLPHLMHVRAISSRLQLKASAELAAGRSDAALEEVRLILRLAESLRDEPLLISYLVRVALVQIAAQPVWEGLAHQQWSETQLAELQTLFSGPNFFADLKLPLDGERAFGVLAAQLIQKKGLGVLMQLSDPNQNQPSAGMNSIGSIIPKGWYHFELVNLCKLYDLQHADSFDAEAKRVFPAKVASAANAIERETQPGIGSVFNHKVLSAILLPALSRITIKSAVAQTTADQIAVACALERYRLAHGEFPDSLHALVPRFISQLPHDAITGESYKYRRESGGKFVLYSVGWNEQDDGGASGKVLFDEKQGDWVWRY